MRRILCIVVAFVLLQTLLVSTTLASRPSPVVGSPNLGEYSLFMQQDEPAPVCMVSFDLPWTHVCIPNPIDFTFINNWLLDGARVLIRGLREILVQVESGPLNIITQTPLSIWNTTQLADARNMLILITVLIIIPMAGIFQGITMMIKELGWGFWKETDDMQEVYAHFILGAFIPLGSFGLFEFLVEINNRFCEATGVTLASAALAEPATDNFLVLLLIVGVQLICFIFIGGCLIVRFFVVVALGLISIFASIWIIRPEWVPYFKQYWTLSVVMIFYQLAIICLIWFNNVIVREAAGEGVMTFVQMIFTLISTVLIWKSRLLIIPLVKQAGLHEIATLQRYLIGPVLRQFAKRRSTATAQ